MTSSLARLRALVSRDPPLVALFVLLYAATLVPIWRTLYLPLIDLPNHLFSIAVWHRMDEPDWGYSYFYRYSRLPAPYWGHYFPTHLLAYLFSIHTANKVYLSLYVLALPLSVMALCRRFGGDPRIALLAFPLALNFNFSWGFISFCGGLPLLFFAIAALDAFLDRPSTKRFAAVMLLTLAVYFAHLLAWVFFGLCAAAILIFHARRPKRALLATTAMLPSVVLAALNYQWARRDATRMFFTPVQADWLFGWEKAKVALAQLPNRLLMRYPERGLHGEHLASAAILLSLLLLMVTAWRARSPYSIAPTRSGAARWLPFVLLLLGVAAYFKFPLRIFKPLDWWNLSPRFGVVIVLLALALPVGAIRGWRQWLLVPAVAAGLLYPIGLSKRFAEFDLRAAGFRHLMDRVPKGSNTLVQIVAPNMGDGALTSGLMFFEFNAYAAIEKGGYNPFGFQSGFPYRERIGRSIPNPGWTSKWGNYRQIEMGQYWDYLITYEEPSDGALMRDFRERVPVAAREGGWRLYHTRGVH